MLIIRTLARTAVTTLLSIALPLVLLPTTAAFAICPLCSIAVGAGIGLAQWLGVDDTITGLWIGGLIVSLIVWTLGWLQQKNYTLTRYKKKVMQSAIILFYFVVIVLPLYWTGVIGHALNKLWGIDKLLLGIMLGSTVFTLGVYGYLYAKKCHDGKAYFPFQKVVMPIVPLVVLNVVFFYLTK